MGPESCPFCGQEIETDAVKCFFCGAELDRQAVEERLEQLEKQDEKDIIPRINHSHIIYSLILLVLICIVGYPYISNWQRQHLIIHADSTVRLNAKTTVAGNRITVLNKDSFDWLDIELQILTDNISRSFSLKVPLIQTGQTYSASAADFIDTNGELFNPYTMNMQKLMIFCKTPTGQKGAASMN